MPIAVSPATVGAAGGSSELLLQVLPQLTLLLVVARVGGALLRRFGQPQVVGEIAAGLLLGPSVFGKVAPGAFEAVFGGAAQGGVLPVLGQFGLVFLTLL